MADSLLAKHDYLGKGGNDARTFWKCIIKEKFRNTRKRGDRDVPEVQQVITQAQAKKKKTKVLHLVPLEKLVPPGLLGFLYTRVGKGQLFPLKKPP